MDDCDCKIEFSDVKLSHEKRATIQALKVLIVDELSMVHRQIFAAMDMVARKVRGKEEPFGGIQLVLIGDFFQLEPVKKSDNNAFVFDTPLWNSLDLHIIKLDNPFRQNLLEFEVLSRIRIGTIDDVNLIPYYLGSSTVESLVNNSNYHDWTVLFALNYRKDEYNRRMNQKLDSQSHIFRAVVEGVIDKNAFSNIPDTLDLKIGTRVMIIRNMPEQELINGDTGTVVGFANTSPVVYIDRKKQEYVITQCVWNRYAVSESKDSSMRRIVGSKHQFPLTLGWALTIHKAQGLSIEKLIIDFDGIFCAGQAYVALSRCRSFENLKIMNYDKSRIQVSQHAFDYKR